MLLLLKNALDINVNKIPLRPEYLMGVLSNEDKI